MYKVFGVILSLFVLIGCGAKTTKTEDIRGIQFGAPITNMIGLINYKIDMEVKGVTIYRLKEYTNHFDQNITLGVYDGNIELISFSGTKNTMDYGAFDALISDMIRRWGKPITDKITEKSQGKSRDVTFEPKNKAVERIIIRYTSDGKNVFMYETYSTKRVGLMRINSL